MKRLGRPGGLRFGIPRGLGPADKAPEVFLDRVIFDAESSQALPILGAVDSLLVSIGWLLRSAETLFLRYSDEYVILHDPEATGAVGDVTLRLPVSKTDCRGNGASRRLTCICTAASWAGVAGSLACPVCAVRRQVDRVAMVAGRPLGDPSVKHLPLFPRPGGGEPSKEDLVGAWRACAPDCAPRGHSARRSGVVADNSGVAIHCRTARFHSRG